MGAPVGASETATLTASFEYDNASPALADTAARTLSVWVGAACMLLAMVPALFLPSRSTLNDTHLVPLTLANVGRGFRELLHGFKEDFGCVPFRKLCLATFLIFNAFNTVAAFSFFIVVYHLFAGNTAAAGIWPTLFGSIGALVTTFAVIPTVAWMSKKTGKKVAFMNIVQIPTINVVDVNSGSETSTVLYEKPDAAAWTPKWSPDGKWI